MEAKKDLAGRLADVFGALGSGSTGTSWTLKQSAVFNAGRDVGPGEDSDEEQGIGEQVMPQALVDSGDEDEEEGVKARPACHTAAFRRQFEQEEEEDAYDRFADEGWQGLREADKSDRPPGSMEVPDDNVFDRMAERRAASGRPVVQAGDEGPAPMEVEVEVPSSAGMGDSLPVPPSSGQPCQPAEPSQPDAGQPQRVSVFDRLQRPAGRAILQAPPPPPPTAGDATQEAVDAGGVEEGTDDGREDGAAPGGARQGKRVRFSPCTAPGEREVEAGAPQGDGRGRGAGAGRGGRGPAGRRNGRGGGPLLNWQRPGYVPDHVKHPERYTVYNLGEDLCVGGGDQAGSDRTSSEAAEAALMRQAVASSQAVAAGMSAGAGEMGDEGGDQAAERVVLAVGAGAIRFTPRVKRQEGAGPEGGNPAAKPAGPTKLACMVAEGDDGEDAAAEEQPAAPATGMMANGRSGARRQFRTKQQAD